LNVTPFGSVPVSIQVGAGVPVAVTVKVPAVPTVYVVLFALVIAGAEFIVNVKLWLAFGVTPFCAVIVIGYVPPAVGVPDRIPVAALNVMPFGSVPLTFSVGAGVPVAVTANVAAMPAVNVALFALVIAGAESTVNVKLWLAFGATPFCAVIVIGYVPPAVGVPDRIPVAALNVTPAGKAPLSLHVGEGAPIATAVNAPARPSVKVALFALVIAGAESTVNVKPWLAFGVTPFCAVIVIGYVPVTVGIPDRTPVAELKVTPFGSIPLSLHVGAGAPVAVTANVPAVPSANVALFALVIAGAESNVSVTLSKMLWFPALISRISSSWPAVTVAPLV
jgi:hypothetical protein